MIKVIVRSKFLTIQTPGAQNVENRRQLNQVYSLVSCAASIGTGRPFLSPQRYR